MYVCIQVYHYSIHVEITCESWFPFPHVGPKDRIQVLSLGGKHLNPLGHLTTLVLLFLDKRHVAQTVFKLAKQPRITLSSCSSCLYHLSTGRCAPLCLSDLLCPQHCKRYFSSVRKSGTNKSQPNK